MSTIVKILPFDEVTTKTAHKISLHIDEVVLNVSATFRIALYDSNDVCFTNKQVTLEGKDYLSWGTDDKYVLNYVAKTLGLTLLQKVE